MPGTINHQLVATTPDNTTAEIRPSHWNAGHAVTLNAVGSEISGALSNSNNVSFGLATNGALTATASFAQSNQQVVVYGAGNTTQGSSGTFDARSLSIQGAGGVSVGVTNGSVVVSGSVGGPATVNFSAGTTSGNLGSVVFANANNVSFGLAGSTVTGSASFAAQTVQTAGLYGLGNTTGASSSTVDARSISFSGAGAVSVGLSGGAVVISAAAGGQSNQTLGLYGSSQTTGQSSSSTVDARSLTVVGAGVVSVGLSGGSLVVSATTSAQTVQTQNLHNVTLSGNTAGVLAAVSSGTLTLAGGNNITLSQVGNAVTISGANAGGAQTGISGLVVSNTTYTSGTVTLQNANGISFGSSGANGISASYTVPVVPVMSVGVSTGGNTLGNTGTYSGQVVLAGGNNITLSVSSGPGGAQSITISGPNAGGAQTGISALVVSNTTYTSGTITLQNANGISFGSSGANGISASYTVPSTAGLISAVNFSAGTTSGNLGSVVYSNSNGVSFGLNGSTITGSVAAQTAQTVGIYGSSQTVGQSSSSTADARSISFVGQGIVSVGLSGGSVLLSATTVAQSNQTEGRYALGNTTGQSSSSTFDARTLSISGAGGVSVGYSGNALVLSSPVAGGFQSAGVSNVGNTLGNTGLVASQLILAGGNNITVSQGTAAGGVATVTISAGAQSNQSIGIYGSSQTTGQSSSSTVDARSITFVGAGVVSVGLSGGSVIISSPQSTVVTLQSVGISTAGNTAGNTGMTLQQVVLAGGNNITLSGSTNGSSMTVTISAGAGGGGMAASAGTQSGSTGTLNFVNSNGITWGMSGSSQITASYSAIGPVAVAAGTQTQTGGTVSFLNSNGMSFGMSNSSQITASYTQNTTAAYFFQGNTTGQSSSSAVGDQTISISAGGGVSAGLSGGSILLSAPATSSLVGVAGISISSNGSTISISLVPQLSSFNALGPVWSSSLSQVGQGSVQVYPMYDPEPFFASRADILASVSVSSSSNSSHAGVVSAFVGIYTRNGSTLSLATSGSQSYQWTNTSNNSLGSVSGFRRLSVPIAVTYAGGDAWVAVMSLTSSTNANWFTASNVLAVPAMTAQLQGLIGEASNNTKQMVLGSGIFSTTSAGMPVSMALSAITGQGSAGGGNNLYMAPVMFANVTA